MTARVDLRSSTIAAAMILMILALAAVTAVAQQEFTGETTVNVVEVPVRVVDTATGAPVIGLQATDFVVRESGREQEISNFAEVARPPRDPGHAEADLPPSAVTRPVEVVYFFDLYLMLKGDKERAVDGLRELYRSSLAENERVSVVAFDGELEVLLDRSADIYDLDEALEEVEGLDARGIEQYISFTDSLSEGQVSGERNQDFYERRQRSREYFFEMERKVNRVGSALSATMARFALADADKVVIAFTPGFPGANWSPTYSPVDFLYNSARYPAQDLWEKLARQASDLGFTLHVIDSSGLRGSSAADAETGVTDTIGESFAQGEVFGRANDTTRLDPEDSNPELGAARTDPNAGSENLGQWLERTRKNLLIGSAETTGGSAHFAGDVAVALAEVQSTMDHFYSLAYTASHLGDGEVYEIEVDVPGHPTYEVIHRMAYIDTPVAERQGQRLRSSMLFGADANPLGIQVERGEVDSRFRLGAAGSKRVQLPLQIKVPFARIEMIPAGEVRSGSLLVTFFGEDDAGNQSQLSSVEQPVTVAEEDYAEAVSRGYFSYTATVEVEGGQQRVYVGIQDQLSGRVSIMPLTVGDD